MQKVEALPAAGALAVTSDDAAGRCRERRRSGRSQHPAGRKPLETVPGDGVNGDRRWKLSGARGL